MTTTDYNQQALDFLNATSTAITVKWKKYDYHFAGDKQARHIFRVRLKNKLGSYNFDFGQSIAAGAKEPTAYDILACLTKYNPESFGDFCNEYGYDNNREALTIYKRVVKEWEGIENLFNEEQLEQLRDIQ